LQRLIELGLARRDIPFGFSARDTKRTLYRIADPFLRFWFRYVEPNRSLLEARRIATVESALTRRFGTHVAGVWEELARASVPGLRCDGRSWKPASRWWGHGTDRQPLEIDILAESEDGEALLFGEAKWSAAPPKPNLVRALRDKAERFPHLAGRRIVLGLWLKRPTRALRGADVFSPRQVLHVLR
jgi:hypothetical protein